MGIAAGTRTADVAACYRRKGKRTSLAEAEAYAVRWRVSEAIRDFAHYKVLLALKAGALVRPDLCPRCGKPPLPVKTGRVLRPGSIHAHHPDYAEPLLVVWLCRTCHHAEHARLRREAKEIA